MSNIKLLDCTLRDGGYYNNWDFNLELIHAYLQAMVSLQVSYIEIGFRSLINDKFKGGCAYSTDNYINSLNIPEELKDKIGVMLNGFELLQDEHKQNAKSQKLDLGRLNDILQKLFTSKEKSQVSLVRIACHVHEFLYCLPAANWLKDKGYKVGFNLMQVSDRTEQEIMNLATNASDYPIDVLYFADSMGCLDPEKVSGIINAFKKGWHGELGIHTHDNMGLAISNTLQGIKEGVTWVDGTVTGMGRGPGNAQTEYLAIALEDSNDQKVNTTKLFGLVREHFKPLQKQYEWGTNPYYYIAGKYGIHPSYIQEMLSDSRYNEDDILAVLEHLKLEGGKKFCVGTLESARHFYSGVPRGTWQPADDIQDRDVLIIGAGPSVAKHNTAIENYIKNHQPYVIALNTQNILDEKLINIRAACHPIRLLADCNDHLRLSQPLATPASMLPEYVKQELSQKVLLDYGMTIKPDTFEFHSTHCILPVSLVAAYALAIAASGQARRILLAGFDGYGADDPRRKEIDHIFQLYENKSPNIPIISLTPTIYEIPVQSVYAYEI